jgi:hypothetical protein
VAPVHAVAGSTVFAKNPCFWWRPYCVGGPVVAFIPAAVGVSAVPFKHAVAGVLLLLAFLLLTAFLLLLASLLILVSLF